MEEDNLCKTAEVAILKTDKTDFNQNLLQKMKNKITS